ncbi:MAG: hypothetical protein KC656_00940 [Myxococcales bacterium]|nr:hypothetical protein [Myxococcales bacterium]
MRTLVLSAALLASTPALAGGFGLVGHGGFHTEKVFFYSSTDPASGVSISEPLAYPQFGSVQAIPQFGSGVEFILGDRDDRIIGVFRGFWNVDLPQGTPCDGGCDVSGADGGSYAIPATSVVAVQRTAARHVGMATMGLSWNFFGDTDKFAFGASAHLGSGVLTSDHNEFFQGTIGPTASLRLNKALFVFGDVHYLARFRKVWSHGTQITVGARYLFD